MSYSAGMHLVDAHPVGLRDPAAGGHARGGHLATHAPFPAPAAARPVPRSVQSAPEDVPGVAAGAERRG